MTLTEAASLHSPAFDIVQRHQFQRCACGCGQLVNRTWAKGHNHRMQEGQQTKLLQVRLSPEDYAQLQQDAERLDTGMATLLKDLWRRECGG